MTRGGPTGVGSDPGSPTSINIIYRSRGMTSPDPEIDGGLPWIRGVDPAAGTRPGSRQDPAQEPTPKPPGSRGGSDPATNLGTTPPMRTAGRTRPGLHGRETRPPSNNVMSGTICRLPFPQPCCVYASSETWHPSLVMLVSHLSVSDKCET